MKRTIALRKRYKAFGRGSLQFILPENRHVLAFLRRYQDETILVVANLSHAAQHIELNLSEFEGQVPRELFGGMEFATIGSTSYFITLGPYAFYWLSIEQKRVESLGMRAKSQEEPALAVYVTFSQKAEALFEKKDNWPRLEKVLLTFVKERRWFRGKAKKVLAANIIDVVPLRLASSTEYLVMLEVEYREGEPETYTLPLTFAPVEEASEILNDRPSSVVARLKAKQNNKTSEFVIYDAMVDKDFVNTLLTAIVRHRRFKGKTGSIVASSIKALHTISRSLKLPLEFTSIKTEQTNTSVIYEDQLILKLFRKVEDGVNPDVEIGRFLTEKQHFPYIPPVLGMLEYKYGKDGVKSLAIVHGFVRNEGDAWQYTIDSIVRYFETTLAHPTVQIPPIPRKHVLFISEEATQLAKETIGPYLASAQLLGERTAQLHIALSSADDSPEFAAEPFTPMYQNSMYHSMRRTAIVTIQLLRQNLENLPDDEAKSMAQELLNKEKDIIAKFQLVRSSKMEAYRIRCHGDLHLGQVLFTGKDFVFIDFEGEPARPLSERRIKRSPLRDVAGMIRSFHYASHMAISRYISTTSRPEDTLGLEQWGTYWYIWVSAIYLSAYLSTIEDSHLLPESTEDLKILLDAYLLEKATYEVGYELNNRPDWVQVPLNGILQLIEAAE